MDVFAGKCLENVLCVTMHARGCRVAIINRNRLGIAMDLHVQNSIFYGTNGSKHHHPPFTVFYENSVA